MSLPTSLSRVLLSRAVDPYLKNPDPSLQNMKFLHFFLILLFNFVLDPDPDPQTQLNPDPIWIHSSASKINFFPPMCILSYFDISRGKNMDKLCKKKGIFPPLALTLFSLFTSANLEEKKDIFLPSFAPIGLNSP